ncbi:MAG TPA: NUDIX domain-containing protein [Anaerolineae bacterium]|nr:NUDIX domain-containing protein [Anaerolineae bacterium]
MTSRHIRPIAICVIEDQGRLFVFEACDPVTGETFYRPLGGGIEFGELGVECIVRELREEIGAEVEGITFLGLIENRFIYNGQPGHEIVLVYRARFADPHRYRDRRVQVYEEGEAFVARWVSLASFENGTARLVPQGLLDMLGRGRCSKAQGVLQSEQ